MTHDEMIEAERRIVALHRGYAEGSRQFAEIMTGQWDALFENDILLIRAAIRVIAPAVWQPVETAPEDGDMFVTDGTRVEVAFRDSGMSSYRFFSPTTHSDLHFQPTHWMPVPALPSAP